MIVLGVAGLVINLCYGFQGTGTRLGEYEFVSESLSGLSTATGSGPHGNRFANSFLARLPILLPTAMVRGADLQKRDFECGMWSFLAGEHKHGGWWYYYAAACLLKVPLGTLLLFSLTLVIPGWTVFRGPNLWLLLPAGCFFAVVSSQTGFSRYFRYVLPASPFVMVWISQLVAVNAPAKMLRGVVAAALLVSITSSLCVAPHWLSFFNRWGGGSREGHHYLIDANIDWGQDLYFLRDWCEVHRDARPLRVSVHSLLDPIALRVPSDGDARRWLRADGCLHRPADESGHFGWVAISAHMLHSRTGEFQQLLRCEPDAVCGASIYVFNLDRILASGTLKTVSHTLTARSYESQFSSQ